MKTLVFLLLLCGQAQALTLGTIRSDCRTLVKDIGPTRERFTDAQLNRFINEAQKDLTMYAKPLSKPYQFELVAGTTYYPMPSDFISVIRLTRSYQVLQELSVAALDKNLMWQTVGGLPINYYVPHSSRTLVGFYPFPSNSTSTGTIRMEYTASATDLSSDSDIPFNSVTEYSGYHYLLSYWCAYRADIINMLDQEAGVYYSEYKRGADMFASDVARMPNYRPSAMSGSPGP